MLSSRHTFPLSTFRYGLKPYLEACDQQEVLNPCTRYPFGINAHLATAKYLKSFLGLFQHNAYSYRSHRLAACVVLTLTGGCPASYRRWMQWGQQSQTFFLVLVDGKPANRERQLRDGTATYSISQRSLEVVCILVNVRVNAVEHLSVSVPHQFSHRNRVDSLNEFPGRKRVAESVSKDMLAEGFGEPVHTITHSKFSPLLAALIAKKLSFILAVKHKALDNLEGIPLNVNNALGTLPFGFLHGENNALIGHIDMARLNSANFLWACACEPAKHKEASKGVFGAKVLKQIRKLCGSKECFPMLRAWLLHLGKRSAFKVALLYCPIIEPLHSDNCASGVSRAPVLMTIHPFVDVIRFNCGSRKFCYAGETKKALKMAFVPFATARAAMFYTPSKILRNERLNCDVFHALYSSAGYRNMLILHGICQPLWVQRNNG